MVPKMQRGLSRMHVSPTLGLFQRGLVSQFSENVTAGTVRPPFSRRPVNA